MSWYADTDWDLTFRSAAAWEAFAGETAALARQRGWRADEIPTPHHPARIIDMCGEREDEPVELDGLRLYARTWGKWFGDDVLEIAAKYADGTVDFTADGGERFRLRLHAGAIAHHQASITYPDDLLDPALSPREAAAVVAGVQRGEVDEYDLAALAADPAAWIADSSTQTARLLRAGRGSAQAPAGTGEEDAISGPDLTVVTGLESYTLDADWRAHPAGPATPRMLIDIVGITRRGDYPDEAESWTVTGRLELAGAVHDFAYDCEDLGSSGLDQTLTVTRGGVDQGYEGWICGDPPPPGATPIASMVDGRWLADVIRDASVQRVWDGRVDGEQAAIGTWVGARINLPLPPAVPPPDPLAGPAPDPLAAPHCSPGTEPGRPPARH